LGWDSTDKENDTGVDWTAPWSKNTLTCYPHVMTTKQDGTYVGGQEDECEEIINLKTLPLEIVDYKIDAMNLDLILHYQATTKVTETEVQTLAQNIKIKIQGLFGKTVKYDTDQIKVDTDKQTITFVNNNNLKQDTEYKISFGEETLIIHTPKQEVIDGTVYAVVGDGVNTNTDVNNVINSDVSTPATAKPSIIDEDKNAYGIYELESIGYNSDLWSKADLTLTKYDHIIRPENGKYIIAGNIDASPTKANTIAENKGGFGTNGYSSSLTKGDINDIIDELKDRVILKNSKIKITNLYVKD
ncbi:MAG: hypothetical protein ACK5HR_03895, partial [Mycoplasmatales bacterium]